MRCRHMLCGWVQWVRVGFAEGGGGGFGLVVFVWSKVLAQEFVSKDACLGVVKVHGTSLCLVG